MQEESIVVQQFDHQLDIYTTEGTGSKSAVVSVLEKLLARTKQKKYSICEFGGGSGATLAEISARLSNKEFKLTNIELAGSFGKHQVNKEISFKQGSILDTEGIPSSHFDVVFTRNVLHHLIAARLSDCRINQKAAIANMLRIIKPGGFVIIEEQTNQLFWARLIIFYASRLATMLKINIPQLQITPYTIVAYMSQNELKKMIQSSQDVDQCVIKYRQWSFPWWMKYPLLLINSGATFAIIRKK